LFFAQSVGTTDGCGSNARAGGKNGWTFEWTVEGRAAGEVTGRALMKDIEETFDAISLAQTADATALGEKWKPILLRGPKSV
jgi:hypothetical protein